MRQTKLHHGKTCSTSELRKAGVKGVLPKPEQYHPEFVTVQDGVRFTISAPKRIAGCGRTLFVEISDYIRANSREDAKAIVRHKYPTAEFKR